MKTLDEDITSLKRQGINFLRNNRLEEAKNIFVKIIEISSEDVETWYLLGCIHGMQGKLNESEECSRRVIILCPDHSEAHVSLGNVLVNTGRLNKAILHFQAALQINPSNALAYNNLGNTLREQGKIRGAIECYRYACKLRPNYVMAYNNLALTLRFQGKLQDAEEVVRKSLSIQPENAGSWTILGNVLTSQGDTESAITAFEMALRCEPGNSIAHSSLLMAMQYYPGYSPEYLLNAAKEWESAHSPLELSNIDHDNPALPDKRLKVGYVSGDFCNHPVGYFIDSVLINHDKLNYEVFCYYNNIRVDESTRRLRDASDHWRSIVGQSDLSVAEKIRADGIDILVDLSGHTRNNRLLSFMQKPAPIQVTWLGYVNTTGLKAIDYIIGDKYVIPEKYECNFVEQVIRLPNCYLCFTPPSFDVPISTLPAISGDGVTFGCFNNVQKITPEVVASWSMILKRLPQARLKLKNKSFGDDKVRRKFQDLFIDSGIDVQRIEFSGDSPRIELLSEYNNIDICLDPFPYTGGTTTLESLWMGVPIITLCGDRFVSRVGATILANIGLSECITDSLEAYIDQSVALASDLPRLIELRRNLRDRLLNSPICDGSVFTQNLEAAYRRVWKDWCQSRHSHH